MKIDKGLLPIKAHYFFFFAALGPLLPQLNVFGRQLGVSPGVMGMVTAVLPLLWAAAKPTFGYVVDYWPNQRKLVFMLLITIMTGSYCGLWFLPMPEENKPPILEYVYRLNNTVYLRRYENKTEDLIERYHCHWTCNTEPKFELFLPNSTYINTVYIDEAVRNDSCSLLLMDFDSVREDEVACVPKDGCDLLCFDDDTLQLELNENATQLYRNKSYNDTRQNRTKREIHAYSHNEIQIIDMTKDGLSDKDIRSKVVSKVMKGTVEVKSGVVDAFYMTAVFWVFVVLMCIGTVAFNVANCIGDAVCFDVLGPDRGSKYGVQRAWGTCGYGVTALLGGWMVDAMSGDAVKDFTPAFIIAIAATAIDLYSCRRLTLPSLSSPDDSGKALLDVLKIPRVILFIIFAIVAGTFDSFIIYYMFWFLEELAEETGSMAQIKLIEGVVVAAESFIGELLFFFFSGKIIKRFGYRNTLTFCLFCYGLRMMLISLIRHPWHLVYIECIMQGPTYALCYCVIVGYAAQVAPEGYSATVQGIVAGVDDGLGFAIGSLVGGQLYSAMGGRGAFRCFSIIAVAGAAIHGVATMIMRQQTEPKAEVVTVEESEKMLHDDGAIYKDTVVTIRKNNEEVR